MLATAAAPVPVRHAPSAARNADAICERIYIGTQNTESGGGIVTAAFDPATGTLSVPRVAAEAVRPTWLLVDPARGRLYATGDARGSPQVFAFAFDTTSGDFQPIGATALTKDGATHLALAPDARTLFVAQYASGQVAVLPLTSDGGPLAPVSVIANVGTGPAPQQTSAHAHAVVPDPSGRYLLVADLGADRIFVYRFDPRTRELTPAATPFAQVVPGTGPRHIAFGRDGRFAYVVGELSGTVRTFRWDARAGRLHEIQALAMYAPDYAGTRSAAEIAVAGDGAHVYASDRGAGLILVYAVDRRTGLLREIQRAPAGGNVPWSFGLDPGGRWMLVANQGSDRVDVLPRDPRTGRLSPSIASVTVGKPVAIAFAGAAARCL